MLDKKIIIYSFFFLALLLPCSIDASIIEVCTTCKETSIKHAVEKAQAGDTIIVKKGLYQETGIIIDKPLTLRAEAGVVLDGQHEGEILLINKTKDVIIDGFEIRNVGTSYLTDYAGVRVRESRNFIIENLSIYEPFFGIYLEKSSQGIVRNNKIYGTAVNEYNSGNGIQLWYSHFIEIYDNEVYQVRDGIYFEFSNHCTIKDNISQDNVRYGLHFMFSNNDEVDGNLFKRNGAGIAIMFSKEMHMHNNRMEDNWGSASYGVLLKEVTDTSIKNNDFVRNTTGINVEGCNRIMYTHNNFESNGWAIKSRGANYLNEFRKNNFLQNSFDLSYNGPLNRNVFEGNFWSDYNGYDLDKDGVGDVPYRPVKLFNYIVGRSPESIILLRSMFIDLIEFSEKVSPVFTPEGLLDAKPSMKKIDHDRSR